MSELLNSGCTGGNDLKPLSERKKEILQNWDNTPTSSPTSETLLDTLINRFNNANMNYHDIQARLDNGVQRLLPKEVEKSAAGTSEKSTEIPGSALQVLEAILISYENTNSKLLNTLIHLNKLV